MVYDLFNAQAVLHLREVDYTYYRLGKLEDDGLVRLDRLPFTIRILLESLLRNCNEREITRQDVLNLASWKPVDNARPRLPFMPARVIMQDFTGVPAIVDLAAMRSAMARLGGDPRKINPLIPVDLVIDHSIQVDFFVGTDALTRNTELEFQRNSERYEFLHWGQRAFENFRVVPPATGIVHQVNLEYLAEVVQAQEIDGKRMAFPDSLVGTDSHTTMINGLGVLGWGVGGIEAEAAMLGQPVDMLIPDVIGFKLSGILSEGVTATDLTLTVTEMLRKKGVVGKFVEFFGPGLEMMSLPDRATIANMAPEYGATMGFFPVDQETLRYLRLTGRSEEVIERVEAYCRAQSLFHSGDSQVPEYTDVLELDLVTVQPSLAGPKRPQDRVNLNTMKSSFRKALLAPKAERGFELTETELQKTAWINGDEKEPVEMHQGAVVIAAITSCTNTSNPSVMLAAGLLAKNAIARGLKVKPYVKTSLAPGSRVVSEYLEKAGLLDPLSQLGFNIVGYGCTTCIGNSGPLPAKVSKAVAEQDLVVASVLSGNRNFEGRVHPAVKANYLASPPLVVAYALSGTVDIDLVNDPVGFDPQGQPVYLREIWPTNDQIQSEVTNRVLPEMFRNKYKDVFSGNETWNAIQAKESVLYPWSSDSTYIQEPPYFSDLTMEPALIGDIREARVLAVLGDSITTDHISPAGSIQADSPAGKYLIENGVPVRNFNSYGSRRGNDRLMTRGTFANIRLKNRLTPGVEGGYTVYFGEGPDKGKQMTIYEAAIRYREAGLPLIVLAGKEYGSGSSRDWAAKGTVLLGVKAVLAESYERIHRSNLIGMGVLPLQFKSGESLESLGISGHELFSIEGIDQKLEAGSEITVRAEQGSRKKEFKAIVRIDTPVELGYYRNGGILHTVLRNLIKH